MNIIKIYEVIYEALFFSQLSLNNLILVLLLGTFISALWRENQHLSNFSYLSESAAKYLLLPLKGIQRFIRIKIFEEWVLITQYFTSLRTDNKRRCLFMVGNILLVSIAPVDICFCTRISVLTPASTQKFPDTSDSHWNLYKYICLFFPRLKLFLCCSSI